jgi:RNA polymerase sigma-54 factor
MEMKHGLYLRQKPMLVMTQRLQQALKLLQVPTLELQQILQQELQQNPLLEEIVDFDEAEETTAEPATADTPETPERPEGATEAGPEPNTDAEREENTKVEGEKSLAEWEEYWQGDYDGHYTRGEVQSAEDFYEKVPTTIATLADHLTAQLRLATSDPELIVIGEYLIGSIDDRGYLTMSDAEVAEVLQIEEAKVSAAVAVLQSLDPPGVAAHDIRGCLLIQLRGRDQEDTLAYQIVDREFENLKEKRFHEIARALRITVEQVQEAADVIATLNPRPGNEIASEDAKYVVPDLVVDRVDDEYVVYLNDRNVPRLRISNAYRELMTQRKKGDETQEYILGKLNSAKWLIQTIEQRRRTMVKVMNCIVDQQHAFFDKGISQLRPLTLQQVVSQIGMHESTVSRVTTNKYVQTPRGVFELKYFFSSGLETSTGEDMSAKTARDIIQQLIDGEDKKEPLSDQRIADVLHSRGLHIARRTVAKYREQMGVLPARYRKRH